MKITKTYTYKVKKNLAGENTNKQTNKRFAFIATYLQIISYENEVAARPEWSSFLQKKAGMEGGNCCPNKKTLSENEF